MKSRQPQTAPRRIVRMKDIAERGNVSLATVSRVLRGENVERFTPATRDRVLQVARELGWSPNRLVQSIQTGRTGTAGVLMVPFGEHWQRVMIGLHSELLRRDSIPLALYPDYNLLDNQGIGTELDHLQHLMERRVDGIICWPLRSGAALEYLMNVCALQVPVVTIDFELPIPGRAIIIRTLDRIAMEQALDHLTELGHRRIGFVGRAVNHAWAVDRRNIFAALMRERGLAPAFIEEIAKGDRSAFSRLDRDIRRATAVIAGSEHLALSVWHVAREAQLRVPRDLSIVGFGQPRFEFALWPTFTYIDQQPEQIGQLAAKIVVDADVRAALKTRVINTEPVLVKGETTAPTPNPEETA